MDYGFIYSAGSNLADNFAVLGSPTINQQGRTAFFATLSGGDVVEGKDDNGIWAQDTNGDLQLLVRAGERAPGTTSGTVFSLLNSRPALSADGRVTFQSTLAGPDITQSNASGIWSQDGNGQIQLVAQAGNPAPGTSANFASLTDTPTVNAAGRLAFVAALIGTDVTPANNRGIWSDPSGTLAAPLSARGLTPAPGIAGVTFGNLQNSIPVIGDNNDIAFRAILDGSGVVTSNNASLWEYEGGVLSLLAREGDIAPGVTDATFLRFEDDLLVNANGHVAFIAALSGSGVTADNNLGIWAEDSAGMLQLVARTGDLLDVDGTAGSDERIITDLGLVSIASAMSGPSPAFTATGELAFFAEFADSSSGIFVADLFSFVLPGDYNFNGVVDAADFTVWRDNLGSSGPLGDGTGPGLDGIPDGIVDLHDYDFWVANFGATSGSQSAPEPAGGPLVLLLMVWACCQTRRSS